MNSDLRLQCIEEQDSEHWDHSLVRTRLLESKASMVLTDNHRPNINVLNQISQNLPQPSSPNGYHHTYRSNDSNTFKPLPQQYKNFSQKSIGLQEDSSHLKESKQFLDENSIDATFLNFINNTREDYQYNSTYPSKTKILSLTNTGSITGTQYPNPYPQNNQRIGTFSFSNPQQQQQNNHLVVSPTFQNQQPQKETLNDQYQTSINQMNDLQNLLASSINRASPKSQTLPPLDFNSTPTYSQIMKKYSSILGDSTSPSSGKPSDPLKQPLSQFDIQPNLSSPNYSNPQSSIFSNSLTNSIIPIKHLLPNESYISNSQSDSQKPQEYTHTYRSDQLKGAKLINHISFQQDISQREATSTIPSSRSIQSGLSAQNKVETTLIQTYDDVMKKYLPLQSPEKQVMRVNHFEDTFSNKKSSVNQSIASSSDRCRGIRDSSRESRVPIATSKELLQNFSSQLSSPNQTKLSFGHFDFSTKKPEISLSKNQPSHMIQVKDFFSSTQQPLDASTSSFHSNKFNQFLSPSQFTKTESQFQEQIKKPQSSDKLKPVHISLNDILRKPSLQQLDFNSNLNYNFNKSNNPPFQTSDNISPIGTPKKGRFNLNNTVESNSQLIRNFKSDPVPQPQIDLPQVSSRYQQPIDQPLRNQRVQEGSRSNTPASRGSFSSSSLPKRKIFNNKGIELQQIKPPSHLPFYSTPKQALAEPSQIISSNLPSQSEFERRMRSHTPVSAHSDQISMISDNLTSQLRVKVNYQESMNSNAVSQHNLESQQYQNQSPYEGTNAIKNLIRNIKSDEQFSNISRNDLVIPNQVASLNNSSIRPASVNREITQRPHIEPNQTTNLKIEEGIPIRCVDCDRFFSQNIIENHHCNVKDSQLQTKDEHEEEQINKQLNEIHRKLTEIPTIPSQLSYRNQISDIVSRLKENEITTTGLLRDSRCLFSLNQNIQIHPNPDSLSIHILSQRAEVLSKNKIDARFKKQHPSMKSENQMNSNTALNMNSSQVTKISPRPIQSSNLVQEQNTSGSRRGQSPRLLATSPSQNSLHQIQSSFNIQRTEKEQKQSSYSSEKPRNINNKSLLPLFETTANKIFKAGNQLNSNNRTIGELKSDSNSSIGRVGSRPQKLEQTNLFAERLTHLSTTSNKITSDYQPLSSRKNTQISNSSNIFTPSSQSAAARNLNNILKQQLPQTASHLVCASNNENNSSNHSINNKSLNSVKMQEKCNLSSQRSVFYGLALSSKLRLPVDHPGCQVDISNILNIALHQNIPESKFSEFIDSYFNKLK